MASTMHKKNDDDGCGCGSWIFATILIVTPCMDTPAVGPDTPDMKFLSHLNFSIWAPQPLKLTHPSHSSLSLSLSLSHSRYSFSLSLPQEPSLSPNSRTQKSPPKSIPRPRRLQIRLENHLPRVFLPGVSLFPSSSRGNGSFKVR